MSIIETASGIVLEASYLHIYMVQPKLTLYCSLPTYMYDIVYYYMHTVYCIYVLPRLFDIIYSYSICCCVIYALLLFRNHNIKVYKSFFRRLILTEV
jgi:hypothetical protein